jgi:type IV secretion system protein VirD4
MGRVGIITHSAAFLAGYNLRLLTVVQAMSQLDATYGEKEARTFATNHGLQILFAPREQRDADEYSAMLGHFTERVTTRGLSRSFSGHGHRTVSRNESEQRRALLLPQEFKELGRDRLVVICENSKPILGEKIRYFQDRAFKARLLPAPEVKPMRMDLHQAKAQQRWRYAEDELDAENSTLDVEALVHDIHLPKEVLTGPIDKAADVCLDVFEEQPNTPSGGSIEPASNESPSDLTAGTPPEEALELTTMGERS